MTELAGIVALVSLAAVIASLARLHRAPTGLSPVRNPVSQYGITPFATGYRVATIAFAVAGLALAVGIDRTVEGSGRLAVVVLLILFAAARAPISWFPMDAPGAERTPTGRRHGLLALIAFLAISAAAFKLAGVLSGERRLHDLASVSRALGWAMLACLLGMALARSSPAARARFGAIERGFYLAAIAWVAVFGLACAGGLS